MGDGFRKPLYNNSAIITLKFTIFFRPLLTPSDDGKSGTSTKGRPELTV